MDGRDNCIQRYGNELEKPEEMGYFLAKDKCPNLEENKIRIVSYTVYKAENKSKSKTNFARK